MQRNSGSYRDPGGYVFHREGRVYRAVMPPARAAYEAVRDAEVPRELIAEGDLISSRELPAEDTRGLTPEAAYVVEHDRIPFVSYPYEWPFALLQKAARFHLGLQPRLLEGG